MLHWCPVWGLGKPLGGAEGLSRPGTPWVTSSGDGRSPSNTCPFSPTVKWSLAEDGGGSTATTGDRLRLAAPCVSPSPRAPGGRRERPRCPWRGWTYRELVRTLRGATSAAQMSRSNHPLPESPATKAGRLAIFFIVIRKNGSGRFFF